MKKNVLLALLFALFVSLPILAQDADTDTPTPEVAATQEATAFGTDEATPAPTAEVTAEVVTATPQATPIVIIITQAPDVPPVEPPPAPTTPSDPMYIIIFAVVIGLFALSAVDRWTNYKLSQTAISQVPADYRPWVIQGAETLQRQVYERANEFAKGTTGTQWDDNILNEEMKRAGWEFYIGADGAEHARKAVLTPTPAAGG